MKKRDVTRHAREVITTDIGTIREHCEDLLEKGELWGFSGRVKNHVNFGRSNFYASEETPTPGLQLLTTMYAELAERRRSAQHIARFIDKKLLALSRLAPEQPDHEAGLAHESRDCCSQAERHFQSALNQLETGSPEGHSKVSIYHDDHGEPLLLRKKIAESTALTLVPLALDNMVVPPGAIVSVDNRANRRQSGQVDHGRFSVHSYQAGPDLRVNPLRLSAWAYDDPLDRGLFAVNGWAFAQSPEESELYYSASKAKMLERTALQDFVVAAEIALQQCAE